MISLVCQPMISDCYKELTVDPSSLQSFLEDEWMSIHGLPYLHTICFGVVSERLFTPTNLLSSVGKSWGQLYPIKQTEEP